MALGTLWYAQQAVVKIRRGALADGTGSSQIGCTTQSLDKIMTNAGNLIDWTGRVTNLTIRGGSRDFTPVNTYGINQLAKHGRPEVITAEFTIITENAQGADYLAGSPITVTVSNYTGTFTSTFTRWQYGEKTTLVTDRPSMAVLFQITDAVTSASNKTINVLMNNAFLTNREVSLSADGVVEEKWTIKCLAQDYYEEDNF